MKCLGLFGSRRGINKVSLSVNLLIRRALMVSHNWHYLLSIDCYPKQILDINLVSYHVWPRFWGTSEVLDRLGTRFGMSHWVLFSTVRVRLIDLTRFGTRFGIFGTFGTKFGTLNKSLVLYSNQLNESKQQAQNRPSDTHNFVRKMIGLNLSIPNITK